MKKEKPAKPYKDFPLYAHATGRWAKTIRGRTCYFGPWDDWKAALERFQDQRDDLYAGRKPRERSTDGVCIDDACQRFLQDKEAQVNAGDITQETWNRYRQAAKVVIKQFGRATAIESLRPEDFAGLRAELAKTRSPTTLVTWIVATRAIFNHIGPEGLGWLDKPVRYGGMFSRPSGATLRRHRSSQVPRDFAPEVIVQAAAYANDRIAPMILLGINCGFGPHDCASLLSRHIDLDEGWVDFPRPKTGVMRRAKLWPETVTAIKQLKPPGSGNVFRTKTGGTWKAKAGFPSMISAEFSSVLRRLNLIADGRGFYSLRRTFQTVAEESGDFPAIAMVMGHAEHTMASRYRQRISDQRLERVSDMVRDWLLGGLEALSRCRCRETNTDQGTAGTRSDASPG